MNSINEMVEVLQAIKDGKAIEYCLPNSLSGWLSSTAGRPNFATLMYRVKREPRRRWCVDVDFGTKQQGFVVILPTLEEITTYFNTMSKVYYRVSEPYEVVEAMK